MDVKQTVFFFGIICTSVFGPRGLHNHTLGDPIRSKGISVRIEYMYQLEPSRAQERDVRICARPLLDEMCLSRIVEQLLHLLCGKVSGDGLSGLSVKSMLSTYCVFSTLNRELVSAKFTLMSGCFAG